MSASGASTLLALDAAGGGCSAAVWRRGRIAARACERMRRGQAERLVPLLQGVMAQAGATYDQLDAVAVTTGPGSFTGVRIALATARGLGLALDVPVAGISSFEALAATVDDADLGARTLLVAIDARRSDIYVQAFGRGGTAMAAPAALPATELDGWLPPGPVLLAGDGAGQAEAGLRGAGRDVARARGSAFVDAAVVARLAAAGPLPPPRTPPRPLYLRPPDVTPAPPPPREG